MECCFAFLRRTAKGSALDSKQSSADWPLAKGKVRTSGSHGQRSSHAKSLTVLEFTSAHSGPKQNHKDSSLGGQEMERPSFFWWLTRRMLSPLKRTVESGEASTRSHGNAYARCLRLLSVSTKASADDGTYDHEHNTCEGSTSRSCSFSSTENNGAGLSLASDTPCSGGNVTFFRRWTDPASPAAQDGVRIEKISLTNVGWYDHKASAEVAFDPLVMTLAAYAHQRKGSSTCARAEDARAFAARSYEPPRAESPECAYHLKLQLESVEMHPHAPGPVERYSHKRVRTIRLLYVPVLAALAPEPMLEAEPARVQTFTHRRTRTTHVRQIY